MLDTHFLIHNTHWQVGKRFAETDPQLKRLATLPFSFRSGLLDELPQKEPGIYTLGGGRQIGKSTLLKQWMLELIQRGVNPKAITFITGELIDDHHQLLQIIQQSLDKMPDTSLRYLIVDEVTYIKQWDRAIKFAADAGFFDRVVLMLTGSDLILMQEAKVTFPGRRGMAEKVDFHLYPLNFLEYLQLVHKAINIDALLLEETVDLTPVYKAFHQYLQNGGFLTAINDQARYEKILPATYQTYSDWIRGDMLKRNKQESYLKEILRAIIKRYGSQVTWNALAKDLSIDHHKTVAEYVSLLESMDAVFVQAALLEDKLTAAPKKARKIMFADPFIFHAICHWLLPEADTTAIEPLLVEACVATHFRRYFPTYYIKAEGEVDVAYIKDKQFWPIEIKWTQQLRAKDLKQVQKYRNAEIWAKVLKQASIGHLPAKPLPVALIEMIMANNRS
jgi:uncharacterized protein